MDAVHEFNAHAGGSYWAFGRPSSTSLQLFAPYAFQALFTLSQSLAQPGAREQQ
jgi:hypothetical protein